MKNIAVICEYNPFHNGHLYQINKIRSIFGECRIIAVMSGNFVQRGEPAILDKYTRARLAVDNGADLVLELIPPYCFAPAEIFAKAGVHTAFAVGADILVFGSECGDINKLTEISDDLSSEKFKTALDAAVRNNIRSERSYIRIRSEVYRDMFGRDIPESPNDILALEYISASSKCGIEPYAVSRDNVFSAGAARGMYFAGDRKGLASALPKNVSDELYSDAYIINRKEFFEKMMICKLLNSDREELAGYEDCEISLVSRLAEAASGSSDMSGLIEKASSKKYTNAKLRRVMLNCLFEIKKGSYSKMPGYTNLLAANSSGCAYLREISGKTGIEIITKPAGSVYASDPAGKADEIFCFASGRPASDAYRKTPYIKK